MVASEMDTIMEMLQLKHVS